MTQPPRFAHPLGGVFSALITPFTDDGALKLDMLGPLAEFFGM